jgi:hypothetical protein
LILPFSASLREKKLPFSFPLGPIAISFSRFRFNQGSCNT